MKVSRAKLLPHARRTGKHPAVATLAHRSIRAQGTKREHSLIHNGSRLLRSAYFLSAVHQFKGPRAQLRIFSNGSGNKEGTKRNSTEESHGEGPLVAGRRQPAATIPKLYSERRRVAGTPPKRDVTFYRAGPMVETTYEVRILANSAPAPPRSFRLRAPPVKTISSRSESTDDD